MVSQAIWHINWNYKQRGGASTEHAPVASVAQLVSPHKESIAHLMTSCKRVIRARRPYQGIGASKFLETLIKTPLNNYQTIDTKSYALI